jgi:hypothetical protein
MAAKFAWTALPLVLGGLVLAAAPAKKGPKPPSKEEAAANLQSSKVKILGKNLIPNGDFEKGDKSPRGWQTIDGLTTFWVKDKDPKHGKVIKFDTDVLQSQAYQWWSKIALGKATAKDAPRKEKTVEPKYDTIAGNDGVWFWSDPVPIEKGKAYWLTIDVKGPPILVWLVGYPKKQSTAFGADNGAFQDVLKEFVTGKPVEKKRGFKGFIHKYVWKGQLAAGGSSEWKTYSRRAKPFRPTAVTPNVKYVRVMIYPFWPPGEYYVDNVRLVEVEDNGVDRPKGGKDKDDDD